MSDNFSSTALLEPTLQTSEVQDSQSFQSQPSLSYSASKKSLKSSTETIDRISIVNQLEHSRQLAKKRYANFVKRKRDQGFTRKYLWLRLDKDQMDTLSLWLSNQDPEDLMALTNVISLKELLLSNTIDENK